MKHTHTMEYYLFSYGNNKILSFAAEGTVLDLMVLNGISQAQRDMYSIFSQLCDGETSLHWNMEVITKALRTRGRQREFGY